MRSITKLLLTLATGGAALAASAAPPSAHSWKTYANVRYAYQVCYPADLLTAKPEAPNGDGRVFEDGRGGRLAVYGSDAVDQTLTSHMQRSQGRLSEGGGQITYKVVKPDWYVISGRQGDSIAYQRTKRVGDTFQTVSMRYPASAAATWNPIAAHVGSCFRSLDGPHYGKPTR